MSQIDTLLDKYWQGETTLEDEQILKDYFLSENVNMKHKQFIPLFQFYKQSSEINCEADNQTLIEKIKDRPSRHLILSSRSIAAAFILTLIALGGIWNMNQRNHNKGLVDNPEEALKITKQALSLIGNKMNKATGTTTKHIQTLSATSLFKN